MPMRGTDGDCDGAAAVGAWVAGAESRVAAACDGGAAKAAVALSHIAAMANKRGRARRMGFNADGRSTGRSILSGVCDTGHDRVRDRACGSQGFRRGTAVGWIRHKPRPAIAAAMI
ncbi:hypothetical protein ASD53_02340 [Lysobacter sp. Root559]|nr:hypothetical protein ASD53_02340 [Lysobacter sp. Root559]KRC38472.1 hypothetical protein ASE10_02685 [Lysobacter sp. Root76]KRD71331.1 hypothetical protein ASE45_05795 [Lysobacter sp. Root96]